MALAEAIPGQYPIPIAAFWTIFVLFCIVFALFHIVFAPFGTVLNRFRTVLSAKRCEILPKTCENFAKVPQKIANRLLKFRFSLLWVPPCTHAHLSQHPEEF